MFPIFDTFPYLLPNFLASVLPIIGAVVAAIWFKETLKRAVVSHEGDVYTDADSTIVAVKVQYKDLFTPHINYIMISFGLLSLMGTSVNAIIPLLCFTPINTGGLGFGPTLIGRVMSARAVFIIVIQLIAFPYLQRRVGTTTLYRWLMALWIPTFGALPLVNAFARHGWTTAVWVGLIASLVCGSIANMAFGKSFTPHA